MLSKVWSLPWRLGAAALVLAMMSVGCPPPVVEVWEPDQFTYDVELTPDAVVVNEDQLGMLVNADSETHTYTFDAAAAQQAGLVLETGKPLVIFGTDVRRITAVRTEQSNTIVETEFVPLTEVITEGTIAWDYGVEFTPERVASIEVPGKGIIIPKAGTPISFTVESDAYTFQIDATLDTETSTFNFTVTKDVGAGATARFIARGELKRFRSRDTIVIHNGELQEFGHEMSGMQGDVTLELVVAASGSDALNLELPVPIMKIPFVVGFLPVVLTIKAQFVANAVVPIDGSSSIRTNFTYDSDLGLNYNGTTMEAGGRLGSIVFGKDINQTGASGPISVNFGVGFPRVELSILADTVVPWAQTAFLIGGSYTFFPACQTADAQFLGAAGYDLGLFGFTLLSGSKTLFSETKPLLRAGDCPEKSLEEGFSLIEDALIGPFPLDSRATDSFRDATPIFVDGAGTIALR